MKRDYIQTPFGSRVKITVAIWAGSIGIVEDAIPNSPYFNVRPVMQPKLRLALKASEFEVTTL